MSLKTTVQRRLADRKLVKRLSRVRRSQRHRAKAPRSAEAGADAEPRRRAQAEPQKEEQQEEPRVEARQKEPKERRLQRSPVSQEAVVEDIGKTRPETGDEGGGAAPDALERTADVDLDVSSLRVEEIKMQVDSLDARVALRAEVANLVRLDVGAQVGIGKVDLDIKGVEAQARLRVHLEQVQQIVTRAVHALEQNPELLQSLGRLAEVVPRVGEAAAGAIEGTGKTVARALAKEGPATEAVRSATHGLEGAV